MKYVTTFVMPVQKKKIDVYRRTARKFAKIWKEHGALEVTECVSEAQVTVSLEGPCRKSWTRDA